MTGSDGLGRGAPSRAHVTARGPFAVGSIAWRDVHGRLRCTLVAKATYELAPGECAPGDDPLPLQEEDGHWDDDPRKSVHVPSDLAPFKKAAELVIVGSAFAPDGRPASTVAARVVVGPVDKSLDAWRGRRFRVDQGLEELPPLTRFSLRYEHAAGGPETGNPAGIDVSRPDARGKYPIPQLLPREHELGAPGDYIPTIGFGPIAPSWSPRIAGMNARDLAWSQHPTAAPLPESFPARFFQAAPSDQWLDRDLAANERLVLEGLHAKYPRLVTTLSGIEPWAIILGTNAEPIRLQGDLLFVDTDRALATLTYRAQIALDEGAAPVRVVVVGVPIGSTISPDFLREVGDADGGQPATATLHDDEVEEDGLETTSVELPPGLMRTATLPFTSQAVPVPAPRASQPDTALPFREAQATPPVRATPPLSPARSAPPPPLTAPAPLPSPPLLSAPLPSPPLPPASWQPREGSLPIPPSLVRDPVAKPPAERAPSPASHPRLLPSVRREPPSASFEFGGVKAASDAAAQREQSRESASLGVSPVAPREVGSSALRRLCVVDLLSFEAKIARRLRGMKRFAAVWAPAPRAGGVRSVDSPRDEPADPDRADILRVLSFGRPDSAIEIRSALADSLEELTDLDSPLVFVAGELRPLFDEAEALRVAVAIAKPVAGGDKKLLSTLAIAEEALAGSFAPRPDTALGLVRQIEQASSALSLPPRYVASEVERVLLENRKYKRRTLLGAARVRADLTLPRDGGVLPLYLPDSIATSLPLLLAYPVVALCEVRPREDLGEVQAEALFAAALGRVLHGRSAPDRPD